MKTPFKSVALLLPFVLTACVHKNQQAQVQPLAPPIVDTPLPAPTPSPTDLPPPVVTTPPEQQPVAATPPPAPEEKPVKHPARHPKNTEQASNGNGPGVSAIGQLSPGDRSDLRNQTEQTIASTEQGLKGINRTLNDQEQKTAAQIREFLKQARAAMKTGDVDGAHTLALKASVLLNEIK